MPTSDICCHHFCLWWHHFPSLLKSHLPFVCVYVGPSGARGAKSEDSQVSRAGWGRWDAEHGIRGRRGDHTQYAPTPDFILFLFLGRFGKIETYCHYLFGIFFCSFVFDLVISESGKGRNGKGMQGEGLERERESRTCIFCFLGMGFRSDVVYTYPFTISIHQIFRNYTFVITAFCIGGLSVAGGVADAEMVQTLLFSATMPAWVKQVRGGDRWQKGSGGRRGYIRVEDLWNNRSFGNRRQGVCYFWWCCMSYCFCVCK